VRVGVRVCVWGVCADGCACVCVQMGVCVRVCVRVYVHTDLIGNLRCSAAHDSFGLHQRLELLYSALANPIRCNKYFFRYCPIANVILDNFAIATINLQSWLDMAVPEPLSLFLPCPPESLFAAVFQHLFRDPPGSQVISVSSYPRWIQQLVLLLCAGNITGATSAALGAGVRGVRDLGAKEAIRQDAGGDSGRCIGRRANGSRCWC